MPMNKCDISINFRFLNDELTETIVAFLAASKASNRKFSNSMPGIIFPENALPMRAESSFDELISPFPSIFFREEQDGTELLVSFSSEEDDELRSLILELVQAAIVK